MAIDLNPDPTPNNIGTFATMLKIGSDATNWLNKPMNLGTSKSPFARNALTQARAKQSGGSKVSKTIQGKSDKKIKSKGPTNVPQRDLAPEPTASGPQYSTFEELLDSILSKYGASSGGGVDRSGYDAAGAKIAAMYKQLEGSYGADAETLKKLFADATASYAANAANASNAINQAYGSTQAERARQLQALGIQESAAVYGDTAARDQASAVSNIARLLEATQGRNTGYQNAALTLNEQMKGVARAQGAAQQAAVEQAYANAMAKAASSGGMDLGDAISIAKSQMSEQDKMTKALTPTSSYGASDVDALYTRAAQLYPDSEAMQRAWVSSQQRTW